MNKDKIIKISNYIGLVSIILLIYWVFIFISIEVFGLKVFRENITQTFYLSIIGILSLMVGTLIISIMFNLTKISEHISGKSAASNNQDQKKWRLYVFILSFPLIFSFLFVGDYLTAYKKESMIKSSAVNIQQTYNQKLRMLADYEFSKKYINQSYEFMRFLSKSTEGIEKVECIVQDTVNGEKTYLVLGDIFLSDGDMLRDKSDYMYKCSDEVKEYLNAVFERKNSKIRFDNNDGYYQFYYPVTIDGKTIILYFHDRQQYGKIGS